MKSEVCFPSSLSLVFLSPLSTSDSLVFDEVSFLDLDSLDDLFLEETFFLDLELSDLVLTDASFDDFESSSSLFNFKCHPSSESFL